MSKKVETKKPVAKKATVKQEQIKAKMIGKNLVVMIDGKKHVLPSITTKDLKKIETKLALYNKANSTSRKEEIINLLKSDSVKEKEVKEVKAKGVKAIIKKTSKEKTENTIVDGEADLMKKIQQDYKEGKIDKQGVKDKIKELQALIAEEKEQAPVAQTGQGTSGRERYR